MLTAECQPLQSPRRTDVRRIAVMALLGLALVPLLVVNLDPHAPVRQPLGAASPMAQQAKRVKDLTTAIAQMGGGRDIELHFNRAPNLTPATDNVADAFYYGLNYAMYPSRAYIGDGRQVLNGGDTLRRADQVPSDARLRELRVAAVVSFPLDAQGLHRPTPIAVR